MHTMAFHKERKKIRDEERWRGSGLLLEKVILAIGIPDYVTNSNVRGSIVFFCVFLSETLKDPRMYFEF